MKYTGCLKISERKRMRQMFKSSIFKEKGYIALNYIVKEASERSRKIPSLQSPR